MLNSLQWELHLQLSHPHPLVVGSVVQMGMALVIATLISVDRSMQKRNNLARSRNRKQASKETTSEFAGNASASSSSSTPSNFDWLADMGATSHMTPHCHWVRNYTPLRVAIRLADNSTVYSAGVGTVVFNSVVKGKAVMPVEFSRVLHVPSVRV